MASEPLAHLLAEVRACHVCAAHLPNPPKPIIRAGNGARIMLVGQAPGRKVHDTGIPWNDASGDRLRDWLQLSRDEFYDENRLALIPTGLCYPGTVRGSDLPPRPECAPLWHPRLRAALPELRLILLIGAYSQAYYLGNRRKRTLAETVHSATEYLPTFFPLPHPSPRNRLWLRNNPWFEAETLPLLRAKVNNVLD